MNHPLLQDVISLVEAASQVVLPYWRRPLEVATKVDDSPITAADMAAHQVLLAGLQKIAPDIPVLSEEACQIPHRERATWQRWWLVDPIDGTKEFIAGTPEFTVNVALIERGQVVFGVVGVPAQQCYYYGGRGLGCWLQHAGQRQPLQLQPEARQKLRVAGSRRHSGAAQQRLLQALEQALGPVEYLPLGSSLKFCCLAAGQVDCYPRLRPTSQWDTAAAQGVLEGAGGGILDFQGQSLNYAAQEDFINPSFIALPAAAPWREQLLALVRATLAAD